MSILDNIIDHKKREVNERKALYPTRLLEQSVFFSTPVVSLKKYLKRSDKHGIIAEFKRKSPSKGVLNAFASPERTTIGYMQAGASALSVLTDKEFFGGSNDDLLTARKFNFCPILRKDFVVDEYQIIEAKSIGADAILLIAAALSPVECKRLAGVARGLGLEVLLEIHDEKEWNVNTECGADVVGVNNRNLQTFEVSLDTSKHLAGALPADVLKVSESGIRSTADILHLREFGFEGFLIGEQFMKHSRPEVKAKEFIDDLKRAESNIRTADPI